MKEKKESKIKNVENDLRRYSQISVDELFKEFETSYAGLSVVDIDSKLEEYGRNSIEIKSNNTIFHKVKSALINPFNMVNRIFFFPM